MVLMLTESSKVPRRCQRDDAMMKDQVALKKVDSSISPCLDFLDIQ